MSLFAFHHPVLFGLVLFAVAGGVTALYAYVVTKGTYHP